MKKGFIYLSFVFVVLLSNAFAQNSATPQVTILKKAPLRIELNKKSDVIGHLNAGEKVQAMFQSSLSYQVQRDDGTIGWVDYQLIKESKSLVIDHHEKKTVPLFTSISKDRIPKGLDKIREMEIGEKVTYLEGLEPKGYVKIRDKDGKIGYTYWQYARPELEQIVPEFEQSDYSFLLDSELNALLKKPYQDLIELLGTPSAQMIDKNGNGIIYYRRLIVVSEGNRSSRFRFIVKNGAIESFKSDREPESYIIESLPLAETFRKILPINSMLRFQNLEIDIKTSDKGFLLKWGIRALKLIFLILFLSIPHFMASIFTTITGYISSLSNFTVIILSMIYSVSFIYVFYLILGLMSRDQHWLLGIFALLVLFFSIKVLTGRISYHRCPFCSSFFKATDEGSKVTGKTHLTEHGYQDVYKGKTETSTQIIHNYERQHYTEKSTDLEIDDYRTCTVCGHHWEVKRFKTVKGHV